MNQVIKKTLFLEIELPLIRAYATHR